VTARTPSQIKRLSGTYRVDRAPAKEASPDTAVNLRTPKGLSKHAAAFWRRYAAELAALGLVTGPDLPAFTLMSASYGICLEALELIARDGLTREDELGIERKHPALQIFRDSALAYRQWATEFGLTPLARGRIDVSRTAPDPVSEFERYLMAGAARRSRQVENDETTR
jgi:P27 family predicted phage terminase small subunit